MAVSFIWFGECRDPLPHTTPHDFLIRGKSEKLPLFCTYFWTKNLWHQYLPLCVEKSIGICLKKKQNIQVHP